MEDQELLLGTYQQNQSVSVCVWNYATGNIEQVYKGGGTTGTNSLSVLNNDYILTAEQEKPLLHIWPLNSQEQLKNIRFVMPQTVTCFDIDSSSNYLIVGIGLKLYVWHVSSGRLMNILQKHYQPITCVKFSSDSAYIIVTGKDGILVVYKLDEVLCSANNYLEQKLIGECEPIYTKTDHSSQISDVCVGSFGSKSRIATISNDLTCRIYVLQTGELLLTLVFSDIPTCAKFDSTSWNIYVADVKGIIKGIYLKNPPRPLEHHIDLSYGENFIGHAKKITCLDINFNNDRLASGSEDFNIIIWEIASRNILRKIERAGMITNLKFIMNHANFKVQTLNSNITLQPLQRNVDTNSQNFIAYGKTNQIVFEDDVEESEDVGNGISNSSQSEINNLKIINKQIYDAYIKMIKKYNNIQ